MSLFDRNYLLPSFRLLAPRLTVIFGAIFNFDLVNVSSYLSQVKTLSHLETHLQLISGFLSPLSVLA